MKQRPTAWLRDLREGLIGRPFASLLSGGILALGCALLTLLFAALQGLEQRAARLSAELGAEVFVLRSGGDEPLQEQHRELLSQQLPQARVVGGRVSRVRPAGSELPLHLIEVDGNYLNVSPATVSSGRMLDPADARAGARVMVLSQAAARALHHPAELHLAAISYRVIGVLPEAAPAPGMLGDLPGNRFALIPRGLPQLWSQAEDRPSAALDFIMLHHADPEAAAQRSVNLLTRGPGALKQVEVLCARDLLQGIHRLRRLLRWSAGAVAGICLLLAGFTLAGLLLISVRDRIPEIGLRLSLGASPQGIGGLFLGEALLLCLLSGLLGLLVGIGAILFFAHTLPLPLVLDPAVIFQPLLAALALGACCGGIPAWKAARVAPYTALRND